MKKFLVVVLIVVSLCVRLYQITIHTEFLGDQGRDALVIHDAITNKTLPSVGPTVGAGYYTGPFYYYLIAPSFIVSNFNPIAPTIEMVIISVLAIMLFLTIASSLFTFPIAYGVSLLWALSPLMIIQDRRLWNPTPIPFFTMLLVASLYWIIRKRYWAFLTLFLSTAALIQLHYVNGISLILAALSFIGIIYILIKQKQTRQIIPWIIVGIILFILLLYPFYQYEMQHGFRDVIGSFNTLFSSGGHVFSKRLYVITFGEICSRLFSYIVLLPWNAPLITVFGCVIIGNVLKKTIISYLLVFWFLLGVACLSFYQETLQPQYAYQFIPIVFLLVAGVFQGIQNRLFSALVLGVCGIIIVSWTVHNPYKTQDPDIPRLRALTNIIIENNNNEPFAFTVMNSRSFTDFHVRYFLRLRNAKVVSYDNESNKNLFILCEGSCPTRESLQKVPVMCFSEQCSVDKPEIWLNNWKYVSTIKTGESAVYRYER